MDRHPLQRRGGRPSRSGDKRIPLILLKHPVYGTDILRIEALQEGDGAVLLRIHLSRLPKGKGYDKQEDILFHLHS